MFAGGRSRAPADKPLSNGPVLSGGGLSARLTAKTPGHWIVDASRGIDSDTASLDEAIMNAGSGDEIALRPGTYAAAASIAGKTLSITGSSADPGQVVIVGGPRDAIAISGSSVTLSGLTLRSESSEHGSLISALNSLLLLRNARLLPSPKTPGVSLERSTAAALGVSVTGGYYGFRISNSSLFLEGSSFSGVHRALRMTDASKALVNGASIEGGEMGVDMDRGSRMVLSDSSLRSMLEAGVTGSDHGTSMRIKRVKVSGTRKGISLDHGAFAVIEDSEFTAVEDYGVAAYDPGSGADVRRSTFTAAKIGLWSSGDSRIHASGCVVRDSRDIGATAHDGAQLVLLDSLVANSRNSGAMSLKGGKITLRHTRISGTSEAGVGVGPGSSAVLADVEIGPGSGAGVFVNLAGSLEAERVSISGHDRCGLHFPSGGGTAKLRDVVMKHNECAISFEDDGASVDSVRGDFRGNRKPGFVYAKGTSGGITLTGADNRPASGWARTGAPPKVAP